MADAKSVAKSLGISSALLIPGALLLLLVYFMTSKKSYSSVTSMLGLGRVSVDTARLYASNAGFSGESLDVITAIAQAESSLDPNATNDNKDSNGNVLSTDRGILQINDKWHPEVSDLDAFNPVTAFREGYRISSAGTDFTPWSTYKNGAYQRYMPGVA